MVLGLIDFLLGGKNKTKVPKNAQVTAPMTGSQNMTNGITVPDGQANVTQNVNMAKPAARVESNLQFQDSTTSTTENSDSSLGGAKKISVVINDIYKELKEANTNISKIANEVKELQGGISSLDHRVSELENRNKTVDDKMTDIDDNMSKFLSLYELVNNQYNPFVQQPEPTKIAKPMVIGGNDSYDDMSLEEAKEKIKKLDLSNYKPENPKPAINDLKIKLLELDTLDIESAAADAVPLTTLKNNTNSLVVILSWLEYLVKRVGVEETKNAFRYYTETLKWITPEVFFDLDKFLRGMEDVEKPKSKALSVKDHIVSLYFISKLNEKILDSKLTNAVLQIIKEE